MDDSQDCEGRSDSPDGLCTIEEILRTVVCTRESRKTVQLPIPILDISNLGNNVSQSGEADKFHEELWNSQEESLFPTFQSDDIAGLDMGEPNSNPDTSDNYNVVMLNDHTDKEEDPSSAAFPILQSDEIVLNAGEEEQIEEQDPDDPDYEPFEQEDNEEPLPAGPPTLLSDPLFVSYDPTVPNIEMPQSHLPSHSHEIEELAMLEKRKRGRPLTATSRMTTKDKRMHGEEYVGYSKTKINQESKVKITHDATRQAKSMGVRCMSQQCVRWKARGCSTILEADRETIFRGFWKTLDWNQKKMYVLSTIIIKPTTQKTVGEKPSARKNTYVYRLKVGDRLIQVCKTMYLNTLGLKFATVRYWLENHAQQNTAPIRKESAVDPQPEDELETDVALSGHIKGNSRIARKHKTQILLRFFASLPRLPSHYCRKSSTKSYLQTDIRSKCQLYGLYKSYCVECDEEPVAITHFVKTMKDNNISLFRPRKDRCDVCVSYERQNISEEEWKKHLARRDQARAEKDEDKKKAVAGEMHVICCDLMAVQPLPLLSASSAYYKLKMVMHNYTIFNMGTHQVQNYWFDESQATLCSSTYATCLLDYLTKLLETSVKDIVIYSDGCTAQNRNAVLSNALLHLSVQKGVRITQKYLEKGHTQMEVDSVHSVIENQIKGSEIYLPSQYVQMTKMARKNPFPYDAKLMQWSDITNYAIESIMRYPSIRPGRKPHDPVVTDIRWLHYDPDGVITFKLNFTDEALPLPVRPRVVGSSVEFPKLHGTRLRIPLDKYRDLQALKSLMPSDCHAFFDELPHEETSRRHENSKAKKEKETSLQEETDVNGKPSGSKIKNERKRKKEDAKKKENLQPKRVREPSNEKPR